MKFCWLPAALILFLCACRKEIVYVVEDSTPDIQLQISQIHNDSSVSLSWNKFTMRNVRSVKLIRQWEKIIDAHFEFQNDVIMEADNTETTSYDDEHVPFSYLTRYVIEVTTTEGNVIYSTPAQHKRTKNIYQGFISDVLADTSAKIVYIFGHDQGTITAIDYISGTVVTSEQLEPFIGFCALGTFNGEKELYVPTNDGWVDIRNPQTLQLKDRIYVAGLTVSSVVSHNGQLFISTSDRGSTGLYSGALKVYDRATKQLISRAGYSDRSRLLLFTGSNTRIAEISLNLLPTQLSSYEFNASGELLNGKDDNYHGDFMLDGIVVKASPDGKYLVSSQKGSIVDSSLVYQGALDDY
jgi:hypothetical protein